MTRPPVILIGVGEMGAVFARGLLRVGHPVFPVNRGTDTAALQQAVPAPAMALLAVAEKDLPHALAALPEAWHPGLTLLQNELLPADYAAFPNATVISVWFEKKKGQDSKVIIPSPAHGPQAPLLQQALGSIGIPVRVVDSARAMRDELVVKNLYILASNIAGLQVGGDVGGLWSDHHELAEKIVSDVLSIQSALTGATLDSPALTALLVEAIEGDPRHQCLGRSAPARLARALAHADRFGLAVPTLRAIAARTGTER